MKLLLLLPLLFTDCQCAQSPQPVEFAFHGTNRNFSDGYLILSHAVTDTNNPYGFPPVKIDLDHPFENAPHTDGTPESRAFQQYYWDEYHRRLKEREHQQRILRESTIL